MNKPLRTIRSRRAWTSYKPNFDNRKLPAPEVWIHHTVGEMPKAYHPRIIHGPQEELDKAMERQEMRDIESAHRHGNGWKAIGYSFLIMPSGRIYEGRGWAAIGAHTEGRNEEGVGICFVGNFTSTVPTQAAQDAAVWLIRHGRRKGKLTKNCSIGGHRNAPGAATACPGNKGITIVDDIKRRANK